MAIKTEGRLVRDGEILHTYVPLVNDATSLWAGQGCNEQQVLNDCAGQIQRVDRQDQIMMIQLVNNDWIVLYSYEIVGVAQL